MLIHACASIPRFLLSSTRTFSPFCCLACKAFLGSFIILDHLRLLKDADPILDGVYGVTDEGEDDEEDYDYNSNDKIAPHLER